MQTIDTLRAEHARRTWRMRPDWLQGAKWQPLLRRSGVVIGALAAVSVPAVIVDQRSVNVPPAVAGWLYLLIVLPITLYWGRATGLVTACVAGFLDYVLFISPRYTLLLAHRTDLLWLLVAVMGLVVTVEVVDRVNRARLAVLRHAAAELERERMEEQREAFLAGIIHDLRTPLTVIRGQAQLLGREVARTDTSPVGRLAAGLGSIEAATVSMSALIDDMLDLTRLHLGKQLDLHREPLDLLMLVQQTVDVVQKTAVHRIGVSASVPELIGRWDRRRLVRIIDNLLTNAIKYSPDGGPIDVRVVQEQDGAIGWAVMSVHDRGVGIPAQDLPHVFDWFHRGENVAGQISGTGIGLAGVKQIVEQHAGTIAIVSEQGTGTTVTARLPTDLV